MYWLTDQAILSSPPFPLFSPTLNRKFYYITLLRDPVSRYLSEWRHVQRGATWKTSLHMCDGRTPTPEELPSCYEGSDWSGCTLQQFMDCPYNLANNRQVQRNKSNTTMPEATIQGNKNSTLQASKDGMCCYYGSEASAVRKRGCTQISAIKCSFKDCGAKTLFFCRLLPEQLILVLILVLITTSLTCTWPDFWCHFSFLKNLAKRDISLVNFTQGKKITYQYRITEYW